MSELSSGQWEYDVQGKIFTIIPFNKKVASARKEDVHKISKMGILKWFYVQPAWLHEKYHHNLSFTL